MINHYVAEYKVSSNREFRICEFFQYTGIKCKYDISDAKNANDRTESLKIYIIMQI